MNIAERGLSDLDTAWAGRPVTYDALPEHAEAYESHKAAIVDRVNELRDSYNAALEEEAERARHEAWLAHMSEVVSSIEGDVSDALSQTSNFAGANSAELEGLITICDQGLESLQAEWDGRPQDYEALEEHKASFQSSVDQIEARRNELEKRLELTRRVEQKEREDAIKCSQEIPDGRFELVTDLGKVTWQAAEDHCVGLGGNLASIHS